MAPKDSEFTEVTGQDDGWNEVESESQIVLENVGDEFTGVYNGMDQQGGSGIWQAHFTLLPDTEAFINAGYDLRKKLEKVAKGTMCKVVWIDNLDTGQKTPMRVFKVLTKK